MTLIRTFAVALALGASSTLARTDLAGCTYTDLVIQATQQAAYASRLYYVPDTGEVCDFLDCGGGRAPPKSTVPGCPDYTGTGTYQPSYINPKTLGNGVIAAGHSVTLAAAPVAATSGGAAASDVVSAMTTASSTTSSVEEASVTILTGIASSGASSEASVTILTGSNTSAPSQSASSSTQTTSAQSTNATSASKSAESSSGAAKTTTPSSAAGAMQTVGAVLGPCVMAAIAAGFA
ncbi:hypothetical protein LEL_07257 [Akanthomyces lecanii RCEF 1005]|uniref:Siderophore biosynthesis enzyme n=1 Tax=Akanthomyces lecanii RCEF 1005 TaxID=1081108 RepID=A0A162N473_CORDF|nr:hypothetical protein LEL_07257 [Akanthomyces lecanii RCEF 1005]